MGDRGSRLVDMHLDVTESDRPRIWPVACFAGTALDNHTGQLRNENGHDYHDGSEDGYRI
ncbi:MAG: hypothetical protein M3N93_10585 [Acidobacteriota bacterium]|nr:hypothetical protein [Acidobacteriota bacterium]